ncbi:endolytic transglycosylase MltG [Alteromonas sp. ASW11-130]|uniref:endolytic transglycosylase MltG n=1 Tax=Alteromonas sp. ASW11-130 TaxID=3015775 RepID=UPI00224232D1|nr:endolytic transglycosylase MltG [Alteromonas sp. ASW11-130]MCW8092018.1 endolytic transglycosylase MltG [Alteromonas sp. ASW11-130]
MSHLVKIVVGLILMTVATVYWWQHDLEKTLNVSGPVLYSVEQGSSGHALLRDLEQRGWLLSHPISVKLWLKFVYDGHSAKAGTYQLDSQMTVAEVFKLFASGDEYQFSVRLVEGLTFSQWLMSLETHDQIEYDIDENTEQALISKWPWPPTGGLDNLEGLLLADTYYFTAGTKASDILMRAMIAMQSYLDNAWNNRAPGLPYNTAYEALIMASIVEKETAVESERKEIAGVFVNRLETNMRLQTDPTVIYGIGPTFDGNLTRKHLKQRTPYNTYRIKGLPPTPIAMAGKPAIEAALHPRKTKNLYFVAKGDGSHHFSATLEEHNDAVFKYQIKRKKQ